MKRLLSCLLLAPLCLAAGCVENVWLPDSSGFVCITRDHTLVHYDLAKKTQRVVAAFDWLHGEEELFERPAVSPDGKRVALVRHVSSKDAETAQIIFYDLASGKEVEKTREIALPGHADFSPTPLVRSGMLFWSPDGKRMLFQVDAPLFKDGKRAQIQFFGGEQTDTSTSTLGIYDIESRKALLFTNLGIDPETVMMGFEPFTPDGRGVILFRNPEKGKDPSKEKNPQEAWEATVFVDWQGREHAFKLTKALLEADEKDRQEMEKAERSGTPVYDDLTPPRREGKLVLVPMHRGCACLDTEKMTADYRPDAGRAARLEHAQRNKVDVMQWKEGLLVQFRDNRPRGKQPLPPDEKQPEHKVEVELVFGPPAAGKADGNAAGKTVRAIEVGDIEAWAFAPNREYLLLRCIATSDEGDRCRRVVIDAKGKVVADFTEKTAVKPPEPPLPPDVPDAPPAPKKKPPEPPAAPKADPGA